MQNLSNRTCTIPLNWQIYFIFYWINPFRTKRVFSSNNWQTWFILLQYLDLFNREVMIILNYWDYCFILRGWKIITWNIRIFHLIQCTRVGLASWICISSGMTFNHLFIHQILSIPTISRSNFRWCFLGIKLVAIWFELARSNASSWTPNHPNMLKF